ncbi:MAG: FtsK/SpoIIIE domain-containing protein [Bacteroidota bacterium]
MQSKIALIKQGNKALFNPKAGTIKAIPYKTIKTTSKIALEIIVQAVNLIRIGLAKICKLISWVLRKIYKLVMRLYYFIKYRIYESSRKKHTIIIGGTGSGKSEFMKTLIHNHILYGKTAIV